HLQRGFSAAADMGPVQIDSASGLSASAQSGARPMHRGAVTATYDFATGALNYYAGSSELDESIMFDASLGGYRVLGVEASDIEASVNWNAGATYENWASEMRLGWVDATFGIIGVAPFPDTYEGPAIEGTSVVFTGGGFDYVSVDGTVDIDGDGVIDDFFMPAEGATVGAFSTYDDGSGLNAGTITGGTITFTLAAVPTPGTAGLIGLAGIAAVRRRR
ncbi:MAG: hypothetical protein ACF8MJ_03220, partial [Phycisphaerales bacterium JB050]